MPELKDILYKVSLTSSYGNMNLEVKGICFDSRKVKAGFLFVAVKGTQSMDMNIYRKLLILVYELLFVKNYRIQSMKKSLMLL